MGQINSERILFRPMEEITPAANDDLQKMAFTGYLEIGDIVDIVDVDDCGKIISVLAENITVLAIDPNVSVTFDTVVDTTAATGTPYLRAQPIDDAQEAIDRLYRRQISSTGLSFILKQDILAQGLNEPSAGKTTYDVADTSFWRVGDTVQVLSDEGLAGNATIESVNVNADDSGNYSTIVISSLIDTSALTNPFLLNTSISVQDAIERNQQRLDEIDRPIENEYIGVGNGCKTVFDADNLLVQGSSKLQMDGKRLRLGTAGTRATLSNGAGNAQLSLTSMVLGLKGNDIDFKMTDPGAPSQALSVAVTGNFSTGWLINVSLATDAGSVITSTAADVAALLNADATAKLLVQAIYGGTGLGLQAALAQTPLAGGLDDGTGDYAELEQVFENSNTNTGYKWFALHIRPDERNRLNKPPRDDEELVVDYREAMENIDR